MKIIIQYDPSVTSIRFDAELRQSLEGFPTVGYILATDAELKAALTDYLRQRAHYRRMARFVDPGDA